MDEEYQRIMKLVLLGCDITEVFSPARVTRACRQFGLVPGELFELRTGYDLSDKDVQQYVRQRIDQSDPELLIVSPPCTKFSRLQQLNIHVPGPEYEENLAVERERQLSSKWNSALRCLSQESTRASTLFLNIPRWRTRGRSPS